MRSQDHDPTRYGEAIAGVYDEMYDRAYDTEGAVEFVAQLAGDGSVLEIGVGTGRLAIPLATRGCRVHGIDASRPMLERLEHKAGGENVEVTIGDFSTIEIADGSFSVVLLAINTIFAMPDQDAQVAVFTNAARHLRPGGSFVVEAWIPDLSRFHRGQGLWPRHVGSDYVSIEVGTLDRARQLMETTQIRFGPDGPALYPANHRYAWPSELDLMARLAGLHVHERWEDWRRTPFTDASWTHVSVYRLPVA